MKLGFFAANLSHLPLETVAKTIVEYGFEMIEIPCYVGNGQFDCEEFLRNQDTKSLKKMLKSYGLEISALSNHADTHIICGPYDVDTDWICPGTKEDKIKFGTESLLRTAQCANLLEVPVVVGFTGIQNFGRYYPFPDKQGWHREEEHFLEIFMPILDKFKEYGVVFALEPHVNNIAYDLHTAKRAVELTGNHPSFGYNFDPANMACTGISMQSFIDEIGSKIVHVHAKDAEIVEHNVQRGGTLMQAAYWQRLDMSFRYRIPGWGDMPWKKIITELSLIGYHGVISYEHEDLSMSVEDGVEKTAAFLKPLLINAPFAGRKDKIFYNPSAKK